MEILYTIKTKDPFSIFNFKRQNQLKMKTIIALTFATIGMHTENAYIALGCATVVLILMTKEFKKSSL